MEIGRTFEAKNRAQWRRWLEKNHETAPDIWLVFHSKAAGKTTISYAEAVEEALCFGWIDSVVKPVEAGTRAQRFTPRRAGSAMSELNKERVRRMVDAGLMMPAGLAAAGDLDAEFVIPAELIAQLQEDPEVWRNFQAFPEAYKRIRIGWITGPGSQRPEERAKRLRYFIKMTKQNKQYGALR